MDFKDLVSGKIKLKFGDQSQLECIKEYVKEQEKKAKECKECTGTGEVECGECEGSGMTNCYECGGSGEA